MNVNLQFQSPPQSILVVDDEPQVCEILADSLVSHAHRVECAKDGLDAVEKMKSGNYRIVITDMDMPRMDGMQLIEYIAHNHPGTDIIAITGHIMKYKYTEVVSAGAADFITKPFTLNELEAKLNRVIRERALREELEKLAVRDPLTGLANRRSFQDVARKEAIRAVRYQHTLFMFFLDVDRFKQYNDMNGHQAGDHLLIATAGLLAHSIRVEVDTVFRYGGDEFVLLLPHLPGEQILTVAERIREKYDALELNPTSLSIGVARFLERSGTIEQDIQDMIHRSDVALYNAKKNHGKDKVFIDEFSGRARIP
ncbi:MAG: diguanylate cyclase [Syntrophobacteraceae bacterium]